MNVDTLIEGVLRREGGYVNHPADKGGPTNFGITQGTLAQWRGTSVTAEDVRAMSKAEACAIYRANYYERPGIATLPEWVQPQLFDMAVNHGPKTALRLLQRVLNEQGYGPLVEDGVIGPATRRAAAIAVEDGAPLNNALVTARMAFYQSLARSNPSQQVFLKGWLRRAEEFREAV